MIKAVVFDCFGVLTGIDGHGANEELFAFIKNNLKPHYQIGLLSNVGSDMLGDLFSDEQLKLIDEKVLSYQIGTVKPDPFAYETTALRLGVTCDECVFVDDIERFCTAAEDVGMKSIVHTNTAQTIAKLKELLDA